MADESSKKDDDATIILQAIEGVKSRLDRIDQSLERIEKSSKRIQGAVERWNDALEIIDRATDTLRQIVATSSTVPKLLN